MTHGAFLGSKSRASPYSSPAWCNRSLEVSVRRRLWAFSGVWGVESRCGSAGPVAGGLGWALVGQHAVGAGRRRLGIIVVVVARRSACGRGQPLAAGEGVREVARPSPARPCRRSLARRPENGYEHDRERLATVKAPVGSTKELTNLAESLSADDPSCSSRPRCRGRSSTCPPSTPARG